jgi:transposase
MGAVVRSQSMPHALVQRARIVLLSGEGKSNREVARRCGVSVLAVSHWCRRYQERGLAGLHDELRPAGHARTTTSSGGVD